MQAAFLLFCVPRQPFPSLPSHLLDPTLYILSCLQPGVKHPDIDTLDGLHGAAVCKYGAGQPRVVGGEDGGEAERRVEAGDVADGDASRHGAEGGQHQRPGRAALHEGDLLRPQQVHYEYLQHKLLSQQ